jgi:3',5'-cyclic-AMP phosphodiesterase
MLDLAHVTDLHLVERGHRNRTGAEWHRLQILSAGRTIDYASRKEKAVQALRRAGRNAAHVVVTGDLTEDGVPAQFELLGELLAEAGLEPERVTLVAGNHDLYTDARAFERALQGPLRKYARTSQPGRLLDVGHALVLPIATAVRKPITRSSGVFLPEQARQIAHYASDCRLRGRPLLIAQHHPPLGYRNPIWNYIDGIDNVSGFARLLQAHRHLHVLHGHTHHHGSRALDGRVAQQIHSAGAIFDDPTRARCYHARGGELNPLDAAQPSLPWLTPHPTRARASLISHGA